MIILQLPCFDTGYGLNEGLGLHLSAEFPFLTTPIVSICHVFVPCKVYQVREDLIDLLREHSVLPACHMSCGPAKWLARGVNQTFSQMYIRISMIKSSQRPQVFGSGTCLLCLRAPRKLWHSA